MKIILYYLPNTRAVRVRWLLEELELPYELRIIDLFKGQGDTPEYKKIHPHGLIPAVEIDGDIMFESCAICHWLTDCFPQSHLAPAINSVSRMQYEQWMFYAPGMLEPPLWENFLHQHIVPHQERVPQIIPWNKKRHKEVCQVLSTALGGNNWLVDNRFSTADIAIGSILMWTSADISAYPVLMDYSERLRQRPAWQRATAEI